MNCLKKLSAPNSLPRSLLLLILLAFSTVNSLQAQKIAGEKFLEDCALLKLSLDELHPGIYRYESEPYFSNAYKELTDLRDDSIQLKDAFLYISGFLAKIRCGHTIANPYNQNKDLAEKILGGKNKLPFTFSIIGGKIAVEIDVSGNGIERGSEIIEINGVHADTIIRELLKYSDGDGRNDNQRIYNLQLTGLGDYEFFDIYFPLVFPPDKGKFEILYTHKKSRAGFLGATVDAVTREERESLLSKITGKKEESSSDQWQFSLLNEETGLLKIMSFVTYKDKFDWKKFLSDAFSELNNKNVLNLIIDLRGNSGGTTEVASEIVSYIAKQPVNINTGKRLVRYVKIPEAIDPFLTTWDNSFKDRTGTVEKYDDRFYSFKDDIANDLVIYPKEDSYKGRTYIIVDASNSSATFLLANTLKQNKLATLVGQSTGGNRKGINGGQLFFIDLPNTGIEVDIPLIGYFPYGEQPDAGIEPDIFIEKSIGDFIEGRDAEIDYILNYISGN